MEGHSKHDLYFNVFSPFYVAVASYVFDRKCVIVAVQRTDFIDSNLAFDFHIVDVIGYHYTGEVLFG
jgi:hypothetical protein